MELEYTGETKDFECAICLTPWTDPVELQCGHLFCKACVASCLTCPECRQKISARKAPNRLLLNMLAALPVRCKKCQWKGPKDQSSRHVCNPGRYDGATPPVTPPTQQLEMPAGHGIWLSPLNLALPLQQGIAPNYGYGPPLQQQVPPPPGRQQQYQIEAKFIMDPATGVRKMNSVWKSLNDTQKMINAATALPVVTSIADQQHNLPGSQVSESVTAAAEMLNDEETAHQVGCADSMAELSAVFAKYQVPIGLVNKLMGMGDFELCEMIIDDSASMTNETDSRWPDGRPMTRWEEVHCRLGQMFEILAFVPTPSIYVRFLNRPDIIECIHAYGEPPQQFLQRVMVLLGQAWQHMPSGLTPLRERIAESLARAPGKSMLRYFFGDGVPNGGALAVQTITQMLVGRPNPAQNPFTFLSCTNEDAAVEWMKECEEVAPYCAEFDDFGDEAREVLKDQGNAFPYTFGMHLVCQLVAAFNPDDLDALDESAPLTKSTLDNLLGYVTQPQEYKHYFDGFLAAQNAQPISSAMAILKKQFLPKWSQNFPAFTQVPMAKDIPVVQQYRAALIDLKARGL